MIREIQHQPDSTGKWIITDRMGDTADFAKISGGDFFNYTKNIAGISSDQPEINVHAAGISTN